MRALEISLGGKSFCCAREVNNDFFNNNLVNVCVVPLCFERFFHVFYNNTYMCVALFLNFFGNFLNMCVFVCVCDVLEVFFFFRIPSMFVCVLYVLKVIVRV